MSNELFSFNEAQKREIQRYVAEQIATVTASLALTDTIADNLNTWAIALATKLNADAGVTDVDYDEDPQA